MSRPTRALLPSLLLCLAALCPTTRASDLGFVAHFSGGDAFGFGSSQSTVTAVSDGGVAGVGDGYLSISLDFPANLGAHTGIPELVGPHATSGASGVVFWLRDTGADDNLQIHVGVGDSGGTFFLSTQGFSPPSDRWQRYEVSFDNPSAWTRIKGNGTFFEALQTADRLLFRHDVPPLVQGPNDIIGDFGVDRVAITPCAYEVYGVDEGGANVMVLDTTSDTLLGTTHDWLGVGAPAGATGFLLFSTGRADLPLFGGTLLVDPGLMLMVPVAANGAGEVVLPLAVPNDPSLVDVTVDAQLALRDLGQSVGWAFSNGLEATLCE